MPATLQNIEPPTPHSDDTTGRLKMIALRAMGLVLLMLSLSVWLSLASWSHMDPSLNHATTAAPQNLLGYYGAVLSDLLFQWIGLAAIMIAAPIAIWGWKLLTGQPIGLTLFRLGLWPVGIAALTIAFATITSPTGWPLATGLGGLVGDLLYNAIKQAAAAAGIAPIMTMAGTILIMPILGLWSIGMAGTLSFKRPPSPIETAADVTGKDQQDQILNATPPLAHPEAASARGEEVNKLSQPAHASTTNAPTAAATADSEPITPEQATTPTAAPVIINNHYQNAPQSAPQTPQTMLEKTTDPYLVFSKTVDFTEQQDTPQPHPSHQPNTAETSNTDISTAQAAAATPQHEVAGAEMNAPHRADEEDGSANNKGRHHAIEAPEGYSFPPLEILKSDPLTGNASGLTDEELSRNGTLLEGVLQDFGIQGRVIGYQPGPVVTLYEFEPARGVKSARVINLADDIARSMSAMSARVAVVPGRNIIGIELSNKKRRIVYLRDILESDTMQRSKAALPLALGTDIGGSGVVVDLARMPHLLIAGTTGSGKSVGINTMICSLLFQLAPNQCKFILIDPKMLELSAYDGIPHLLTPVVTDPKKAVRALKWTVREMEQRYLKMSKLGVRNIDSFNKRVREALDSGEVITRKVQTGFDKEKGVPIYEEETLELEPLPFIVVVVDEMADLMMVAGKDIESAIQRLAQMARAAGIHLITATQRPSVDVITGTIKANFPTRISFQVTSRIDSRTILGEQGAEQLLGQGDMLYMAGGGRITRVHGPFVSEEEVEKIAEHLKRQGVPEYLSNVTEEDVLPDAKSKAASKEDANAELYQDAVEIVLRDRRASTSYLQRRLSIGYNRAASLIERMEEEGIISAANHAGRREILVPASSPTAGDDKDREAFSADSPLTDPHRPDPDQEDVETVH